MDLINYYSPDVIVRSHGDKIRWTPIVYFDPSNPKTEAKVKDVQGKVFHERIIRGSFDEFFTHPELDIVATVDHDISMQGIIGRYPGTLQFIPTPTGIDAEVSLPRSMSGRVNEMIERGEIRGGSFIAHPDKVSYKMENNKRVAEITRFDMWKEVSLVFKPYYQAAEIKRCQWHQGLEDEYLKVIRTQELLEKIDRELNR